MSKKIRVHIDPKGYDKKPIGKELGGIKSRLQKNASPSLVSVEELVKKVQEGHSVSPGIMMGMTAKDWTEQQLFLVDIDNEEDGPILRIKDAKAICEENGLPLAFYYQTFSYTKEHPKFRLAFVMNRPVKDKRMRKQIIETLINLFPQSDKSCVNADRIFLGTNKTAKLLNESGRISWEDIMAVSSHTRSKKLHYGPPKHTSGRSDPELDQLIKEFDLFGYLRERNGGFRRTEGGVVFDNCELCGHHDNLMYAPETNTFYCFSKDVGGTIIDYLCHAEGLTTAQAIHKLKYELSSPQWVTPKPFDEIKLPSFPVRALPAPLCDWVQAVAENTETPVDMAAVSALAVLSCALQGKFKVHAKSGYNEPLNLYILIIANSGERKSPIVQLMTRPIYRYEDRENQDRKNAIENERAKLSSWKKQIDLLEREGNASEAAKLRVQYRELENNRTRLLRLIADDITPEALTSLLAENGGIMTILSTEGGLFDTLAGRYTNNISIDTLLKSYSGDRIRVDRKGRESETINNPVLTMLLSVQDNVLEGLMRNEAFRSRGLTGRMLYCKPKSKVGTRHFDTPDLPKTMEIEYMKLILSLLKIPVPPNGCPQEIRLSPKAYRCVKDFFDWVEPKLPHELEHMDGWGGKFVGTTLRIAGLLHCVQHGAAAGKVAISSDTITNAIKIGRYFLKHALCAYSLMGADKALRGAKHILRKLQGQEKRELTKYQIHRLCRGEFPKAEDVVPVVELLIEHGYLKERTYPAPTGGRPRASGYLLNPLFFDK